MASPLRYGVTITAEEYLEREQYVAMRHELVGGETHAMTGGTLRHNIITGNIFFALRAVRGSVCRVFMNDVLVRAAHDTFYYPDVVAACGSLDQGDAALTSPCLVVEVTSPSSRRTDRREKLFAYCDIASLQTYLLVEQEGRAVEHYWRDGNNLWQHTTFVDKETISLHRPSVLLSLDEIYDGVEFPSPQERLRVREALAAYG